jgi:hypothetical protein
LIYHAAETSIGILRGVLPRDQSWQLPTADRLPPKKSATEKLVLAAALKRTTSVSIGWLAQRLEMGAPDSVGSLLHRFRVSGGMNGAQFKNGFSRFLA